MMNPKHTQAAEEILSQWFISHGEVPREAAQKMIEDIIERNLRPAQNVYRVTSIYDDANEERWVYADTPVAAICLVADDDHPREYLYAESETGRHIAEYDHLVKLGWLPGGGPIHWETAFPLRGRAFAKALKDYVGAPHVSKKVWDVVFNDAPKPRLLPEQQREINEVLGAESHLPLAWALYRAYAAGLITLSQASATFEGVDWRTGA